MFLVRAFLEFDVFLLVFLTWEVAVPILRGRPRFPICRWIGRRLLRLAPKSTTTETLLESSTRRMREAKVRLDAAKTDLLAAETEQKALEMEEATNELREKGGDR